jgi:hypothetical protein
VGRTGVPPGLQGWFYAVQIQANLFGDTNPLDWAALQTESTSGTVMIQGISGPVQTLSGSTPPKEDNPTYGINTSTTGRYDWIDEPGLPKYQGVGGVVVGANYTQTFTSTLKDGAVSCTVNWSTTVQVPPGSSTARGTRNPVKPR